MRGTVIAKRGFLCEEFVTYNVNRLCSWNFDESEPITTDLDEQYCFKTWSDATVVADVLVDFVKPFGIVKEAHCMGRKQKKGVKELTGKESPADIVLAFDNTWFGISLKYGAPNRRVKVFTSHPVTLAQKLDEIYKDAYGVSSGLPQKIATLIDDKIDDADAFVARNQPLIKSIFGEELESLNSDQRSTIRKIKRGEIEHPEREVITEFYKVLLKSSSGSNSEMADEFYTIVSQLPDHQHRVFRVLTNIPEPNDPNVLSTVMFDAEIQPDTTANIKVYDYMNDVNNYLEMFDTPIPLNKKQGRCCFQFGAANIEVNGRAGSRSEGGVNVTLEKKILTNVRFQKISNGKEDQGEPDRDRRSQDQAKGISSIPGGPGRQN